MAYNTRTGASGYGDIEFEGDPGDTKIDFGDDSIALVTGGTARLTTTNTGVVVTGSIRAKSLQATVHNFNNAGTTAYFIPFMSTVEAVTPTYLDHMVTPAHGRLVKALVRMTGAQSGAVTLDLYRGANGTANFSGVSAADIIERSTVTMGSANTTATFALTGSEHFGVGNITGIQINPDAAANDVNVTCIWEYNYIDL